MIGFICKSLQKLALTIGELGGCWYLFVYKGMLVCFLASWQNIWENQLLRLMLAVSFRVFSPWSIGPVSFGPGARGHILVGACSTVNCLSPGQMQKGKTGRAGVLVAPSRARSPKPASSTRLHLLNVPLPPISATGYGPTLSLPGLGGTFKTQTLARRLIRDSWRVCFQLFFSLAPHNSSQKPWSKAAIITAMSRILIMVAKIRLMDQLAVDWWIGSLLPCSPPFIHACPTLDRNLRGLALWTKELVCQPQMNGSSHTCNNFREPPPSGLLSSPALMLSTHRAFLFCPLLP